MFRIRFPFDIGKEPLSDSKIRFWKDCIRIGPAHATVEHGAGYAAAVIADAVQVHHFVRAGIERFGGGEITRHSERFDLVYVIVRKISKDTTSIWRLPPEDL